jgi:hypothetical protein
MVLPLSQELFKNQTPYAIPCTQFFFVFFFAPFDLNNSYFSLVPLTLGSFFFLTLFMQEYQQVLLEVLINSHTQNDIKAKLGVTLVIAPKPMQKYFLFAIFILWRSYPCTIFIFLYLNINHVHPLIKRIYK